MEYWKKESWIGYLKNDVSPLYESCLSILNLWKMLNEFDGKLLSDLIKDFPKIELVFVTGTSPPEKYEENGLAYICRINEMIWYLFTSESFQSVLRLVVDHLPDPLWEWIKQFKVTFSHECYFMGSSLDSYESLSRLEERLQAIFISIAEIVMGGEGSTYLGKSVGGR